jgi:hypothetical protein
MYRCVKFFVPGESKSLNVEIVSTIKSMILRVFLLKNHKKRKMDEPDQ